MRITSGQLKGRKIQLPKSIRPTQDKVRKAIFDILGDIEGLSFLELYAGSGAVGFEAASRGVKELVLVENHPDSIKVLQSNCTYLLHATYYLLPLDSTEAIKRLHKDRKRFDIIFMDPPYYLGLSKKTLQILEACDILAPNGLIIVQHFKKDALPDPLGDLTLLRQKKYGDTLLSIYKKS